MILIRIDYLKNVKLSSSINDERYVFVDENQDDGACFGNGTAFTEDMIDLTLKNDPPCIISATKKNKSK